MNYLEMRKATGGEFYDYQRLTKAKDEEVRSFCQTTRVQAAAIAKAWSPEKATEWLTRNYLAVKMIFASQLHLDVATYCRRKNVLLTQPYMIYYAGLSACRALVLSDPFLDWEDGKLRETTHEKARNLAVNCVRRLSHMDGAEVERYISGAKVLREVFSYDHPARGPKISKSEFTIEGMGEICNLLCELAQANSECLRAAWKKFSGEAHTADWGKIRAICNYDGVGPDSDDKYRSDYLRRNAKGPPCLVSIVTDGMVEDIFGAWCAEEDSTEDNFDPDGHEGPFIFDYTY